MPRLKPLNNKERKKIVEQIKNKYDFEGDLDYSFFISPKNKIFIINNTVKELDLSAVKVNNMGLYIGEVHTNNEVRLSIEGSQMIGPTSKKNVVELSEEETLNWMRGNDLDVNNIDLPEIDEKEFLIMKHKTDFMGCGKLKEGKILNFVPKTRRLNN